MKRSDRELLSRFAREGEASAFEEIVRRHGGLVMAASGRLLRDRGEAEDVFQATFLLLARKASSIREGQALAA